MMQAQGRRREIKGYAVRRRKVYCSLGGVKQSTYSPFAIGTVKLESRLPRVKSATMTTGRRNHSQRDAFQD